MLTAIVAAGLALTACGGDSEDADNEAQPESEATQEIHRALRFEADTTRGDEFEGETLNDATAVLWFWSPGCDECVAQAPSVLAAAENHEDIDFHGVAGRGDTDELLDFEMTHGLDELTNIIDENGTIWGGFEVIGPSTFVFVRPDGTHTTLSGSMTEHELEVAITEELR